MGNQIQAFTFPGGRKRTVTIAATAGNVTSNKSPGAGTRWIVLRGRITVTNDATVASRQIVIQITNGTVVTEAVGFSAIIAASQTGDLDFGEAGAVQGLTLGQDGGFNITNYVQLTNVILDSADQLRILIQNGVAGDSYSGSIEVLEI